MKMIAVTPFDYRQRRIEAGEEFDCEPNHALQLEVAGKVRAPTAQPAGEKVIEVEGGALRYSTRHLTPDKQGAATINTKGNPPSED